MPLLFNALENEFLLQNTLYNCIVILLLLQVSYHVHSIYSRIGMTFFF